MDEEKVFEYLLKQGFDGEMIRRAMKLSNSCDIDIIVSYIEAIQEGNEEIRRQEMALAEQDFKENFEMERLKIEIKEREMQRKKDEAYRQKLIEQIKYDRMEREAINSENAKKIVKTVKIEEQKYDCRIKLRFEDGSSFIVGFNGNPTTEDLFNRILNLGKYSQFQVFTINPSKEIINDGKTLRELNFFPTETLLIKSK
ncbi:UBX domain-containing protein 4 [Astathelohania contejeani]|uniref:UBX domain-containing protein 4 n=1 Tax=Astathelohania contejeani TaxID=164912 RepID=A0ABQ7HWC0_9MICR|nr:UBX domain-containing protein 4 [Thelohania contejeani]